MTKKLTNAQIRKLKALAQRLDPLLRVGKGGISDAFLKSVDEVLTSHELVKIKFAEFKDQKKTLAPLIAEKTSSLLVMRVGNAMVLYREQPDAARRQVQL
jgi:RNA-binding protein